MTDTTLKQQRKRAAKPLLWISIASMAMMFAGLTSGYIVSRSSLMQDNAWLVFDIPSVFYVSTAVMLLSSGAMFLAVRAAREGKKSNLLTMLFATLALGTVFGVLQFYGWGDLHASKIYFAGSDANTSGSWFYIITAFHLLHLLGGWIALVVTTVKAYMGKYTSEDYQGVEMAAIFWHFVDILWIYLFLFLAIIR